MIQVIFLALLIVTLLAGSFAYWSPFQKPVNPLQFMMDHSGFNSLETLNQKKSEQINVTTDKGLRQIRQAMENLAIKQNQFLATLQDQQQALQDANKDVSDILLAAQEKGVKGDQDLLQLEALASDLKNDQRLLVARGQELISLNDQLSQNRQWIAQQVDLANMDTEDSLQTLQQHSAVLQNQAAGFFDQVSDQNQKVQDQIQKMQDKFDGLSSNSSISVQNEEARRRIHRMLNKEHEDMMKLADREQKNKDLLQQSQQHSQDSLDEEHQKEEDQQAMIQQHIEDERQRMQDQQANQ